MAMSTGRKVALIISSIVLGLILIVVLGIAIIFSAIGGRRPSIQDNSVLALKVSGSLPDYVPDDPLRRLFGGQPQSLSSLLAQFRKAKVDKRISAVMLDIDMPPNGGLAKADEIRDAIADFRASSKPVYAYMETGFMKDYYVATACDKIFVPPPGELFTIGMAADVMFFRGSLDKLGIYPDVYQIGKYKSAGDTFTQKQMTDAYREYINSLLDDLYGRYLEGIAKARNKSVDDEKKLKKRLGYGEKDELHIAHSSDYRQISEESLGLNKGEKIAVVFAAGDIVSGKSSFGGEGEETIGSDSLVRTINEARDDKP